MGFLFGGGQTINNSQTKLGALRVQNSSQGVPIPLVYGTTRVAGNLLWYGDFTAIPHTSSQHAGKGGGSTVNNTTYTYTVGVVIGLCEGPVRVASPIGQVWSGKTLTDATKIGLAEFQGTYTQSPWSYLVTNHADQALNYRGTCYVAQGALDLGNSDSLPNLSFEVTGLLNPLCLYDVSPAQVAQDLIENDKYGCVPGSTFVDVTAWNTYCYAANIVVSPSYVAQTAAKNLIQSLANIGNAAPVWSFDTLKFIPFCDAVVSLNPCELNAPIVFTPDLTVRYSLTYDDFLASSGTAPITITRKRQADAYNAVRIDHYSRANAYNHLVSEAKDQASIERYGLRQAPTVNATEICEGAVGSSVAQLMLQRSVAIRNTYEFTVGWRYILLEPMDIVSLTDPLLGMSNVPVRITQIEEDEEGRLKITAEDLSVGIGTAGAYQTQAAGGAVVNTGVDPGNAATPVIFQPPIDLSNGTPQIWLAAAGGPNWGGAQVWVSADGGASFNQVSTVSSPARYGVLTANFPAGSDPDVTNNLSVNLTISSGTLTTASTGDANGGLTQSYVGTATGGEIIDYSTVTLTSAFNYTMSGFIRRGQSCSIATPHVVGDSFVRLDASIAKVDVTERYVGQTLQVKLLSFNKYGSGLQSLANAPAFNYTVQPVGVSVTGAGVPSTITANQVLCVPPNQQYQVVGAMTVQGTVNLDGTLVIQ